MPELAIRGVHYDVARGNYDSFDSLRQLLRLLAECRLNTLVLYMEDLWHYRCHPALANPRAYDIAEMGAFATEAAAMGIDFIPSITTLGHSRHILEKPAYQSLAFPGPHGDFDVLNPAVYDLFAEIFDEVLPHFTSPFVLLNGDEVRYTALSTAARELAERDGIGALYGLGMGKLTRMALERGRRPIIWHDMLTHHPEAIAYLPQETVIAYWFYDMQPDYPAVRAFAEIGFDVLAMPGDVGYGKYPAYARALPGLQRQCRAAHDAATAQLACEHKSGDCLGAMLTIWEELRWQDAVLDIYAAGRWMEQPELPAEDLLRDFAPAVYGLQRETRGAEWVEFTRQFGAALVPANADAGPRSPEEHRLLESDLSTRREALREHARQLAAGSPTRHADLFDRAGQLAVEMATPATPAPHAGLTPTLLTPALVDSSSRACRLITTTTSFGHRLVVLTNGVLAVAILPDFGASLIEWTLLGTDPWSWVRGAYHQWAAEQPRIPGDPGLTSPWGCNRMGGWREAIFFNARANPSSLWGCPFDVRPIHETADEIAVECLGANMTAEIRRIVRLRRDSAVIDLDITAVNRFTDGYLALQPNVGHACPGTCPPLLQLADGTHQRSIIEHDGTMLFTPRGDTVRITSPLNQHYLQLRFHPDEVEQILTDIGAEVFTQEPFGIPRYCHVGDSVRLRLEYEIG